MAKSKKYKMKRNSAAGQWVSVDPHARSVKIMGALNNRKYHARTFGGIAKEVGARREDIVEAIKTDPQLRRRIKLYRRRSRDGRFLVTTKSRFAKEASIKDKFIDVFSSEGVKIEDV